MSAIKIANGMTMSIAKHSYNKLVSFIEFIQSCPCMLLLFLARELP